MGTRIETTFLVDEVLGARIYVNCGYRPTLLAPKCEAGQGRATATLPQSGRLRAGAGALLQARRAALGRQIHHKLPGWCPWPLKPGAG